MEHRPILNITFLHVI